MEKFNITRHGYDPVQVNTYLDQIIVEVEKMVGEIKAKDAHILELEDSIKDTKKLEERIEQYERMENTMNRAIFMAQKTSDNIKVTAQRESEIILDEARRNASRIVNEALMSAERTEMEANMLRRNIVIFKRRLKGIIEEQSKIVDDIENVEL